jgi:hypothetical protein
MTKYEIEGNINFYDELKKSLTHDNDDSFQNSQCCLITNLPLAEHFVTLECNHSFNYIPLYNDAVNSKFKFNKMDRCSLKSTQIRCPYCRTVQNNLLPYYEHVSSKTYGVNFFDENVIIYEGYQYGDCFFNTIDGYVCKSKCVKLLDSTGKTYCDAHFYTAMHDYNKKCILEKRELQKKKRLELKAEEKKKKMEEKSEEKKKKMELKVEEKNKKKLEENSIISLDSLCQEILKTGKNKGGVCHRKIKENNKCAIHAHTKINK